jgi:hypothetical protein
MAFEKLCSGAKALMGTLKWEFLKCLRKPWVGSYSIDELQK